MGKRIKNAQVESYGLWKSPVSASLAASTSYRLAQLSCHDGVLYWVETRPDEDGRSVLVSQSPGNKPLDLTPAPFSVHSRVNEYGGLAYCVTDKAIYFCNSNDQQIYFLSEHGKATPLTTKPGSRFADFDYNPSSAHLYCVREHHEIYSEEVTQSIVSIHVTDGTINTLHSDFDFYASPRVNQTTNQICWICWDHPNMPWDGCKLFLANIDIHQALDKPRYLCGSDDVCITQPGWSDDGEALYYLSDQTGWWNIYQHKQGHTNNMLPVDIEMGVPMWSLGVYTYTIVGHCLYVATTSPDNPSLYCINLDNTETSKRYYDLVDYVNLCPLNSSTLAFIASSKTRKPAVYIKHADDHAPTPTIKAVTNIEEGNISNATHYVFTNKRDMLVHAYYYPPLNSSFIAPANSRPPLITFVHGGPTGNCSLSFDIKKQYWTTRGFAVLDVDYSGSSGYGRAYRERLEHQWGALDVEDCCAAAEFIADKGLADRSSLFVHGSSAGGLTVLNALARFDTFTAGASLYGIGDLADLLKDTHKFEARYFDRLIGEYPEHSERYRNRSPLYLLDGFDRPVIFFQGLKDRVVPPEQSEKMHAALRDKGVATAYITYDNEQHGFRQASTIRSVLDAEYVFFLRVLGLQPPEDLPEVTIDNLN